MFSIINAKINENTTAKYRGSLSLNERNKNYFNNERRKLDANMSASTIFYILILERRNF